VSSVIHLGQGGPRGRIGFLAVPSKAEQEIRGFYDRWKSQVYTLCLLFPDDEKTAEEAVTEAFATFLRTKGSLLPDGLPAGLLASAVASLHRRCAGVTASRSADQSLKPALLRLRCEQRAVFILRDVLGLEEGVVAAATRLPSNQVRALRFAALMQLRELLPKDFLEESNDDC
jgi:DNA-directed RNA polymerase specialized sigma24 family protein